ncbi:MAG: ABC transporter ATP-binding protein [Verrucomicrobia bacterium]|nr:ABC transporter ATP-binding protein [Verrucomicrobiota bacterium]MCH8527668.1 ABC transporter ATP-binding protein/permease [Kiritimatiellia bacterium]
MKSSRQAVHVLDRAYSAEAPFRTLWLWLECSRARGLGMLAVFTLKRLPAMLLPLLTGLLIDAVSEEPSTWLRYWPLIAGQFILMSANIPLNTLFVSQLSQLTRRLENRLRRALTTRLQHLSIPYYDNAATGELQAKVLRDVEQVQHLAQHVISSGFMVLTTLTIILGVTLAKQPAILGVYMIFIPVMIYVTRKFRARMRMENRAFRQQLESMNSEVTQMIDMIPVSRAHGIEEEAVRRVEDEINVVGETGIRLDRINALFQACNFMTLQIFNFLLVLVMLGMASKGWISIGDVVVFMSLFNQMFMQINTIMNLYPQLAKGMESVRSIGEILECPDLELNQGKTIVSGVAGEIEFQNVSYQYREMDRPAVEEVTLHIPAGKSVAVVGPSGGGKSTLLRLTIGFRRPTSGRILLDGADMNTVDMRSWRRFISVVPQESIFFEGTIRENILFGADTVNEVEFQHILDAANVREFVDALPEGLDARIGESGALLSGGQRQRLAIARALVRDPRVIVLDEPTSALDVVSEKLVQDAIEKLIKGRTTLIVAHRLSTIRNVDQVVVMKNGRIVETGTYEELAARPDSEFRRMKDLQK